MKKTIFTLAAATSLCMLAACGSEESEPTLAEICASGLNEDCLVGSWNLQYIQTVDGAQKYIDFGTTPSTLVITDDGKFDFTYTTNAGISMMAGNGCGGTHTYGEWSISGSTLNLKIGRTDCMVTGTKYQIVPKVDEFNLSLSKVIFHDNDMTDALTKSNSVEYFVRVNQ